MYGLETGTVRANDVLFHYVTMGTGPLLVCLHGFPDHAFSFRRQLEHFSALGYRVVAPFMRGYAPTVTPANATFHIADLAHDVVEFVKAMGAARATLLGHDWGAHAAYGAALLAPEMFDCIVTLAAPYGPAFRRSLRTDYDQQKRSWYMFFLQSQLGESAFATDGFAMVEQLWRDWSPGWDPPSDAIATLRATFVASGVAPLAYYRCAFGTSAECCSDAGLQRRIGRDSVRVPCLSLHGRDDRCIGFDVSGDMAGFFPAGLERRVIAGVGHFLHLERPDEINAIVADYLLGRGG
ncbi:MAG: alpha/beta hydrolase [Proteobacteria bacterium]|nr:alpha/beta hydrolase [Pseudomonadota bacterium]